MNNVVIKENQIQNFIYEVRGIQVMLDSDLAKLYNCKNGTKEINQAVYRNKEKFPKRYTWKLDDNESINFLVTNCDQKTETRGGRYKNPRVFTEEGVAMLATILHTPVAIEMSIKIMDAFVLMRKYISSNLIEQKYINNIVLENQNNIRILQEQLRKFEDKKIVNEIYFDGQIYDAYSKIIDIFNMAKNELVIIDAYADKKVLDMIRILKAKVILITKNNTGLLSKLDIEKYNSQYNNLTIKYTNKFHDRYFILDKNIVYHCGSSINHAGSKTFSINLLEDEIVKESIINHINMIL